MTDHCPIPDPPFELPEEELSRNRYVFTNRWATLYAIPSEQKAHRHRGAWWIIGPDKLFNQFIQVRTPWFLLTVNRGDYDPDMYDRLRVLYGTFRRHETIIGSGHGLYEPGKLYYVCNVLDDEDKPCVHCAGCAICGISEKFH